MKDDTSNTINKIKGGKEILSPANANYLFEQISGNMGMPQPATSPKKLTHISKKSLIKIISGSALLNIVLIGTSLHFYKKSETLHTQIEETNNNTPIEEKENNLPNASTTELTDSKTENKQPSIVKESKNKIESPVSIKNSDPLATPTVINSDTITVEPLDQSEALSPDTSETPLRSQKKKDKNFNTFFKDKQKDDGQPLFKK